MINGVSIEVYHKLSLEYLFIDTIKDHWSTILKIQYVINGVFI